MKSDVQIAKIIELEEEDAVLTIGKKINVCIPYDYFNMYPGIGDLVELYQDESNILVIHHEI